MNEVSTPCVGYRAMSEKWSLIHDLLGGTSAMRDAGEKWLPKESGEGQYDTRLGRSILYNGYRDCLWKLVNKPFSRPIALTDVPEELEYLKSDVDTMGTSFENFAKDVFYNLINYGIAHVFVDHTAIPEIAEQGATLTKADEENLGARVILESISPVNLIGWQNETINKVKKLTQIRMRRTAIESSGQFGDEEVNYIKIVTPIGWGIWKEIENPKDGKKEKIWFLVESGLHTFGSISLVTIYANRTGFMIADPCLEDLAWLNLAHWQSYSDQKNILRFSRFGILFGKGFPKKKLGEDSIVIGPNKSILLDDVNADLKYVEHSGAAIAAGAKDVEDIEIKMEVVGQQPLMRSAPLSTATAKKIDESRNLSQLQSWIRELERGLLGILKMACEWRKIEPPETMKVDIFSDFEVSLYGAEDKPLLLQMRQAGEISSERFLREEQRRGVISGDVDIEEEVEAIDGEDVESLKKIADEIGKGTNE